MWLLDEAGSAMNLGHQALARSLLMADGRLPETGLRDQLWARLGATTPQQIKALVVSEGFGAAGFAALAPEVAVAGHLSLEAPTVHGSGGGWAHLSGLCRATLMELKVRLPEARWLSRAGRRLLRCTAHGLADPWRGSLIVAGRLVLLGRMNVSLGSGLSQLVPGDAGKLAGPVRDVIPSGSLNHDP